MPRLAFKPDSSFFRKIAIGAIGTRAVAANLVSYGHEMVELERGSTDTKLWKDVKRKRVRIPDLVCQVCGLRVESRAKTKHELAMSHSDTDEERTQRFTGVKLARLRNEVAYRDEVAELAADEEEDIYIRLEADSYLAAVCGEAARDLFLPYLNDPDDQTKLEAVIALGETGTAEAVELLSQILDDRDRSYFMRSAAAWCLGRASTAESATTLIRAFSDIDVKIREEALEGIIAMGGPAIPLLLAGLEEPHNDIVAGCAEALRQQQPLQDEVLSRLVNRLKRDDPSQWAVWLLGHLPRDQVSAVIADLQKSAPELHYAISVLWSFVESWIASKWELSPGFSFPSPEEAQNV